MNGWKQYLVKTYDGNLKVYNPITRQMEDFEGGAVPEYSSEDAGKVLTVSETGELEWGEAGGSGGGVFIFHSTWIDEYTQKLDKTWNEIKDAIESNLLAIELWIFEDEDLETTSWGYYYVEFIQSNPDGYTVNVNREGDLVTYFTADPDGIPTYIQDLQ